MNVRASASAIGRVGATTARAPEATNACASPMINPCARPSVKAVTRPRRPTRPRKTAREAGPGIAQVAARTVGQEQRARIPCPSRPALRARHSEGHPPLEAARAISRFAASPSRRSTRQPARNRTTVSASARAPTRSPIGSASTRADRGRTASGASEPWRWAPTSSPYSTSSDAMRGAPCHEVACQSTASDSPTRNPNPTRGGELRGESRQHGRRVVARLKLLERKAHGAGSGRRLREADPPLGAAKEGEVDLPGAGRASSTLPASCSTRRWNA